MITENYFSQLYFFFWVFVLFQLNHYWLSLLSLFFPISFNLCPWNSTTIFIRKCELVVRGGADVLSKVACLCWKLFVSWGSVFITKPLVGRDIKTGFDPGVSPLTSLNPRGQIFSNCAITISWLQGPQCKMAGARLNEWMDLVGKSGNL